MPNNQQTKTIEKTTIQVSRDLSDFLAVHAVTGRTKKNEFIHGVIIDGLKSRNIKVPADIIGTR